MLGWCTNREGTSVNIDKNGVNVQTPGVSVQTGSNKVRTDVSENDESYTAVEKGKQIKNTLVKECFLFL